MDNPHITLEVFTDPMMGLTWEQQPVFRKLETHFPSLSINPSMVVLVKNVYQFCNAQEMATLGKREALQRYLERLKQIYLEEESISGMPIVMDHFDLFSPERTSSQLLCLAYEAALSLAPDLAAAFLYRLRFATVVEDKITTKQSEISALAARVGIDGATLLNGLGDSRFARKLEENELRAVQLGARGLPHSVLSINDRYVSLPGLPSFADYCNAVAQLSDGLVKPTKPADPLKASRLLLEKRTMISDIEVKAACDLHTLDEACLLMKQLQETQASYSLINVKGTNFLQSTSANVEK